METWGVETFSGSVYVVSSDGEKYYLTANNVPNEYSEKMPGDEAILLSAKPFPWPPEVGRTWHLLYPTPIPMPRVNGSTRYKRTSTVTKVWHYEG